MSGASSLFPLYAFMTHTGITRHFLNTPKTAIVKLNIFSNIKLNINLLYVFIALFHIPPNHFDHY
jgi:hypothetical protein